MACTEGREFPRVNRNPNPPWDAMGFIMAVCYTLSRFTLSQLSFPPAPPSPTSLYLFSHILHHSRPEKPKSHVFPPSSLALIYSSLFTNLNEDERREFTHQQEDHGDPTPNYRFNDRRGMELSNSRP